ncbi:ribokinase [Arthrobacter sp. 260]|uniref:ribokinase n=1 Tax=Arthrobacter sp. 260 TaxID=2735314 RepID=UPI001490EE29|nr:ribokinase [Arthrobacter sp. 260]NOJ58935.1 ribokinase [Arthrobacter sp. 260]
MSTEPSGVVVVGSINADLVVTLERHPQPGETLLGRTMTVMPGGKGANQAVAAAKLGARTVMIGAVGQDTYTEVALSGLNDAGVDTGAVERVAGVSTGVAIVEVDDSGENTIVVIPGANAEVTPELVAASSQAIADAAVLVLQGEIPAGSVTAAVGVASGRVVINLAPVIVLDRSTLLRADPLVVNEHEGALVLAQLAGSASGGALPSEDADSTEPAVPSSHAAPSNHAVPSQHAATARALVECGFASVVMTLGGSGALLATASDLLEIPAPKVPVVDTTGAGDAFTGALAARLSAGDSLPDAVRVAVLVGAYAVGTEGAQPSYPSLEDPLPAAPGTTAHSLAGAQSSAEQDTDA